MVAGIAAGLLYAPRPGSEMRGQIRERATDLGEKARDRFNRIRGKTNESEETAWQIPSREYVAFARWGTRAIPQLIRGV